MRETMFLLLGLFIGGALGTFMMCALTLGARYERFETDQENDEARL